MHVMLTWEIQAQGERWTAINTQLKDVLKGYSWVRPLRATYIVKVNSPENRLELKTSIIDVIKSTNEKINFVMTPAMEGGSYTGWLPKDLWDKVNQRTKP